MERCKNDKCKWVQINIWRVSCHFKFKCSTHTQHQLKWWNNFLCLIYLQTGCTPTHDSHLRHCTISNEKDWISCKTYIQFLILDLICTVYILEFEMWTVQWQCCLHFHCTYLKFCSDSYSRTKTAKKCIYFELLNLTCTVCLAYILSY